MARNGFRSGCRRVEKLQDRVGHICGSPLPDSSGWATRAPLERGTDPRAWWRGVTAAAHRFEKIAADDGRCLGWLPSFSGSGIRGGSRNPNAVGHKPTLNITLFTTTTTTAVEAAVVLGMLSDPSRLRPYRSKALFPQ